MTNSMVHDVSCKLEVANLVKKFPAFMFVYGLFNDTVRSYGLDSRGSISIKGKRFLSTPQRPNPLSGSSNVILNGYRGLFPRV
jgi:hypothetical protein